MAVPFAFVAEIVNVEFPMTVGVPLRTPDVLSVKPGGIAPTETAQLVMAWEGMNGCE